MSLIYPNIIVNQNDIEIFESSPDAYIFQNLEKGDNGTCRSNCINLMQELSQCLSINSAIIEIVGSELANYNKDTKTNWCSKINAINFLIPFHRVPINIDIEEFTKNYILPELDKIEDESNECTMIKSTCLKYLYIFRNRIPKDWIKVLLLVT